MKRGKKKAQKKKKKIDKIDRDVAKPRSGIPKSLRGRFFYGKFYAGNPFFFREILRSLFFFTGKFCRVDPGGCTFNFFFCLRRHFSFFAPQKGFVE